MLKTLGLNTAEGALLENPLLEANHRYYSKRE